MSASGRNRVEGAPDAFATVTELAAELGVTARTLRFYEDRGLIAPRRLAATRVYSNRERARMILILRGKRLGFSIKEIRDYLDLYDADPRHEAQSLALLERIGERRARLLAQRAAIEEALLGLDKLKRDAETLHAKRKLGGAENRRAAPRPAERPDREGIEA